MHNIHWDDHFNPSQNHAPIVRRSVNDLVGLDKVPDLVTRIIDPAALAGSLLACTCRFNCLKGRNFSCARMEGQRVIGHNSTYQASLWHGSRVAFELAIGLQDALVSDTTPQLLRLGVVHDVGVVDRRLPLRDLTRLALPLRLHVLRLRLYRQPVRSPLWSVSQSSYKCERQKALPLLTCRAEHELSACQVIYTGRRQKARQLGAP